MRAEVAKNVKARQQSPIGISKLSEKREEAKSQKRQTDLSPSRSPSKDNQFNPALQNFIRKGDGIGASAKPLLRKDSSERARSRDEVL